MNKFWWKGEPLVIGSLHWRVIDNDLRNKILRVEKELRSAKTLEEAVGIAHRNDLHLSVRLTPRKGE